MSTKYETGLGKPFPDRIFAPLQKKNNKLSYWYYNYIP